jgi:hypothetical protein
MWKRNISSVISGFRREVDENCALLGCYSASSVIYYRRFGTIYRSYLQGPSGFLTSEDGTNKLSRNVGNYHYSLRNNPKERSTQNISFFALAARRRLNLKLVANVQGAVA